MRLQVPIALGFLAGMFMIVQFFVPHPSFQETYDALLNWNVIIGAFALVLGLQSLFRTHVDKIRRRRAGSSYSLVTLTSFAVMFIAGIFYGGPNPGTLCDWLFMNVQVPLEATMFSLLAFFIASAAYRTFRARTPEATVLLVTAIIVMLGRVPIGEFIYARIPEGTEWIMSVPTVGAKRGIMLGVALGVIATSLRILLGIERSHLGGGR